MDTKFALEALSALAHETRLGTFRLLMRNAPGGLAAGEIARHMNVIQNTMSAHLSVLTRSGLIEAKRDGRSIRYRASPAAIRQFIQFLMEDCCQGAPEVCAPLLELTTCKPAGNPV